MGCHPAPGKPSSHHHRLKSRFFPEDDFHGIDRVVHWNTNNFFGLDAVIFESDNETHKSPSISVAI
jgi:hypothetical protein